MKKINSLAKLYYFKSQVGRDGMLDCFPQKNLAGSCQWPTSGHAEAYRKLKRRTSAQQHSSHLRLPETDIHRHTASAGGDKTDSFHNKQNRGENISCTCKTKMLRRKKAEQCSLPPDMLAHYVQGTGPRLGSFQPTDAMQPSGFPYPIPQATPLTAQLCALLEAFCVLEL